jgi:hypothetical protein
MGWLVVMTVGLRIGQVLESLRVPMPAQLQQVISEKAAFDESSRRSARKIGRGLLLRLLSLKQFLF